MMTCSSLGCICLGACGQRPEQISTPRKPFLSKLVTLIPWSRQPHGHLYRTEPQECNAVGQGACMSKVRSQEPKSGFLNACISSSVQLSWDSSSWLQTGHGAYGNRSPKTGGGDNTGRSHKQSKPKARGKIKANHLVRRHGHTVWSCRIL